MTKAIGFLNLHDDLDLGPLTTNRSIASTSFLGRYALMDFQMSNFSNSGIDEIGVLLKQNIRSLVRHMGFVHSWIDNTKIGKVSIMYDEPYANNLAYNHDINNFIENKWVLEQSSADIVVIAPAHIINKIDYRPIIERHLERDSRITMLYTGVIDARSNYIGNDFLTIDANGHVKSIKPNKGEEKEGLLSLQTYIFNKEMLESLIQYGSNTSSFFNLRDALAYICKDIAIDTYEFNGFMRSFDSLSSYLSHSLELLNPKVRNQLFSKDWPIYTKTYDTAPTVYGPDSNVKNSFISNGAMIEGEVVNSVIGRGVKVSKGAKISNSVILTETFIDENICIDKSVVDKNAKIIHTKKVSGTFENPLYIKRGDII